MDSRATIEFMWKLWRHCPWKAELINGGSCKCTSKSNSNIDGRSSDLGRNPARTSCRRRLSALCADCRRPLLMLPHWPALHRDNGCTNWWRPSEVRPRQVTHLHLINFSLSQIARVGQKTQRKTYVRHILTTFSLAALGECCVHTCTWMSFMRSEWISSDAQEEASALPSRRNAWICDHWYLELVRRTTTGNQHDFINPNSFSEWTRAIPIAQINSTQLATIFLNNWVMQSVVPPDELTENVPQCASMFFTPVCQFATLSGRRSSPQQPITSKQMSRLNITSAP